MPDSKTSENRDAMSAYERFHQVLKRDFLPVLRASGFKGSGPTFRRQQGDRIDLVNIQGSGFGGQCCVNVGLHFSFLPTAGGLLVGDVEKIKEYQCAFRNRLHEAGESDHWWTYGDTDCETEASVANLIDVYQRRSPSFFGKFEPFRAGLDKITPAQLDHGDVSHLPGRPLPVALAAFTMARLADHLGQHARRREFADVALRHLGDATDLKAELERLRAAGDSSRAE